MTYITVDKEKVCACGNPKIVPLPLEPKTATVYCECGGLLTVQYWEQLKIGHQT